jgi:DNA polymerase zeta
LRLAINQALGVNYRSRKDDPDAIFVAHIGLVKGVPFYGYHVGYRFFLKIYLFNPSHITRLADLLRSGAIIMPMQPFESHMQYVPQWMCDYNLYGCDYLECTKFAFRHPIPAYEDLENKNHLWHDRSIRKDQISDETILHRQSHCPIEIDICVQDILNRLEIHERSIHHDFSEAGKTSANAERLVHSMAGLWKDETRRRKAQMGLLDSDGSPFPPEVLISVSAGSRNSSPGGWIHEEDYRLMINEQIEREKTESNLKTQRLEEVILEESGAEQIQTAFGSISELYPENFAQTATFQLDRAIVHYDGPSSTDTEGADIDEARIIDIKEDLESLASDNETPELSQQLEEFNTQNEDISIENINARAAVEDRIRKQIRLQEINSEKLVEEPQHSSFVPSQNTISIDTEEIGIRKRGDYDHIAEDAFELRSENMSDCSQSTDHITEWDRAEIEALTPSKRRRLNGDTSNEPCYAVVSAQDAVRPLMTAPINHADTAQFHADLGDDLSLRNSQPNLLKDTKLSFAVVKDPQDPETIQRLSQHSNGNRNITSQQAKKQVAFNLPPNDEEDADSNRTRNTWNLAYTKQKKSRRQGVNNMKMALSLLRTFHISKGRTILCYARQPPLSSNLIQTFGHYNLPAAIPQGAFYSNEADVPDKVREYAGRGFKLQSNTVPYLPDFDPKATYDIKHKSKQNVSSIVTPANFYRHARQTCTLRTWEIKETPPTWEEVDKWMKVENQKLQSGSAPYRDKSNLSQIDSATQKHEAGNKYSQLQEKTSVRHEAGYMSVMSLEIHVNTREAFLPDPKKDEISCVFWCFQSEDSSTTNFQSGKSVHSGILALSKAGDFARQILHHKRIDEIIEESTEIDLLTRTVDIVRKHDPDIITGFEVHNSSWGYLIERAQLQFGFDFGSEISRTKSDFRKAAGRGDDKWNFNQTSTVRITGRHTINIWRAMRGELNLLQYTMENIVFHILQRRIPHYSYADLTKWYKSTKPREILRVIDYYTSRVRLDLDILEHNELVPRLSEQARLLGVDFFSVVSRGSQFKVESLMFRIAKPENFLLISPSRKQVGQQNALECLPLVMEPQSAFYPDPVLVLDFQSLYPSIMIAYNYCYSTFLGRVVNWRGQNKMGFTDYSRSPGLLETLKNEVNIAPNGMIYVKPDIRKSLLAKMLGEILETRVMVKSGMKQDKEDKILQRLLNNRQLALKLIANVTYGYTSASFSGRMPCSEIADSIVQTARETLEKAIALIHSVDRWGAEVVYGDTDSLFISLKGRTREQAFDIGEDIVKAVTDMNPRPVKLKFEKVYQPCVLLAKKRYVGFKYETRSQVTPEFDAKGIETVRRDGTPAEQKIEEKALKILFQTADLSKVKSYFQSQCAKIMRGKISIQDFCFAREVKLGTYSDRGTLPPGAMISAQKMLEDPRAEPQYGERVPYVVVSGAPGSRLIDRCVDPNVLLQNDYKELDADYYILKNIIPPLERIFNLVGANVKQWYEQMPKYQRVRKLDNTHEATKDSALRKRIMESYLKASTCIICQVILEDERSICVECMNRQPESLLALRERLQTDDEINTRLHRICRSCGDLPFGDEVRCDSKDCPVFYTRRRHIALMNHSRRAMVQISKLLENDVDDITVW